MIAPLDNTIHETQINLRLTINTRTTAWEIAAFYINWAGEILDTIAKVLGKYGTWLGIKKNRMCFIVNIICCTYWIGIDVYRNLWSQALFTIPTIALQIYGYYKWGKDDKSTQQT